MNLELEHYAQYKSGNKKGMKKSILCLGFIIINICFYAFKVPEETIRNYVAGSDTLPTVLTGNRADIVGTKLKGEALLRFAQHQLPKTKQEWERYRTHLRNEIIKKTGIVIDHELPLNYQETGTT